MNITTDLPHLELLEELGLVTHTHLSHGAPTYHAAGEAPARPSGVPGLRHGRRDRSVELLRPLAERLRSERGFLVDIGHVALFGLCRDCGEQT